MRAIEATVTVTPDGLLTADVHEDIPAGEYQMLLVIKELPAVAEPLPLDYLTADAGPRPVGREALEVQANALLVDPAGSETHLPLDDFPIDDVGPWPENLSLRREDMYDDWGR